MTNPWSWYADPDVWELEQRRIFGRTWQYVGHSGMLQREGDFFAAPIAWQQRLWPTEEFELARSRVPVRLPETDLFAGLEEQQ